MSPHGSLLAGRCRQLMRCRARVERRADADSVHDLRVAARRLEEALRMLEAALPPRANRRLRRRARKVRRRLGPIRNADVMADLVRGLARRAGAADRDHLRSIAVRLTARAAELRRGARAGGGLRVPRIGGRIRALLSATMSRGPAPTPRRARQALAHRRQRILEALSGAKLGGEKELHALRIAIKKYRYTLEILDQLGHARLRPVISTARALQTELGDLHDRDVLIALLRRDRGGGAGSRDRLLALLRAERSQRLGGVLRTIARFRPHQPAVGRGRREAAA